MILVSYVITEIQILCGCQSYVFLSEISEIISEIHSILEIPKEFPAGIKKDVVRTADTENILS